MRRRVVAGGLTMVGAVFVEMPDWIPLLDEAVIMFLLLRVWQWAGVDLTTFLKGNREAEKKPTSRKTTARRGQSREPKRHSRIIRID